MAKGKWYFSREQIENTPSIRCGFDKDRELSYRQQAANFIQDMGQKLKVNQLCINTAIVYMHRFYMFHSFTRFHRTAIAAAALFLAAKVEEQPRRLDHIIQVTHMCLYRDRSQTLDVKSERYLQEVCDLVFNENVLLQTLGFDVAVDHPHTHIVRCCDMVRANKDLARTSYFMASNSLHLTTMCLQYKPTLVACFCIHLACKWSNWQIPKSSEGKDWFWYVDKSVTLEHLEQLTEEFLHVFDKCPTKLKRRLSTAEPVSAEIQDQATKDTAIVQNHLPTKSEATARDKGNFDISTELKSNVNQIQSEEQVRQVVKSNQDGIKLNESVVSIKGSKSSCPEINEGESSCILKGLGSSNLSKPSPLQTNHRKRNSVWLSETSSFTNNSVPLLNTEQNLTGPTCKRPKQL